MGMGMTTALRETEGMAATKRRWTTGSGLEGREEVLQNDFARPQKTFHDSLHCLIFQALDNCCH